MIPLILAACVGCSPVKDVITETIDAMTLPGMDVIPRVIECGSVNAAYIPAVHGVIICAELLSEPPEVIRFIMGHEMGHAIIDQYSIPITGSEEAAADELAAVYMEKTGHGASTLDMAVWYVQHPDGGEDVWDDHPSNAKRAATLVCLGDGSYEDSLVTECRRKFTSAKKRWTRLINFFGAEVAGRPMDSETD